MGSEFGQNGPPRSSVLQRREYLKHHSESLVMETTAFCQILSFPETVPRKEIVHCRNCVTRSLQWLEFLKRSDNTPVLINGLAKTGKTSWLWNVLPSLIRSDNIFGIESDNPALIWKVNCLELKSNSTSEFMQRFLAKYKEFTSDVKCQLPTLSAKILEKSGSLPELYTMKQWSLL
eukprot:m.233709 g.233709  ORF g.233709 m.233709 type:complete len:176 (+) comp40096_c0_seq5:198-725(+)